MMGAALEDSLIDDVEDAFLARVGLG